jgi:hypothetical protein
MKDNELDFIYFLNNFIQGKGVVGVVRGGLSLRCTVSNGGYSYKVNQLNIAEHKIFCSATATGKERLK